MIHKSREFLHAQFLRQSLLYFVEDFLGELVVIHCSCKNHRTDHRGIHMDGIAARRAARPPRKMYR